MIKAVATDFDGPLTDPHGLLHLPSISALRALEAHSLPVILASGMTYPALQKISAYLGCTGAVIAENGAVVAYHSQKRILGDPTPARSLLAHLTPPLKESWSNPYRHVDLALKRPQDLTPLMNILPHHPNLKLLDSGVAYHLLDATVDKGLGLKTAATLMHLHPQEIAAIGDSETDLPLLSNAGLKIALQHSPPLLKHEAHHTTTHPYGEGFQEAVTYILSSHTNIFKKDLHD